MFKKFSLSGMLLIVALAVMGPYHGSESEKESSPPPTTATQTPSSTDKPLIAITEIFLDSNNPQAALTNLGTESVQMQGWFLCNRPGYFQLPNLTLKPGQRVVVHLGSSGNNTVTDIFTGGRLSKPSKSADELALYLDSNFSSPDSMVDYVQWGRAGQNPSRENVAIRANLWSNEQFVNATRLSNNESIYFDGQGNDASNYFIGPSVLAEGNSNDVVLVHSLSDLSISPSMVELRAGQAVQLMNVVKNGIHNPVELLNASGNTAFDVSFNIEPGTLVSAEFTPSTGTYTLSHRAHGHPIEAKIIVR